MSEKYLVLSIQYLEMKFEILVLPSQYAILNTQYSLPLLPMDKIAVSIVVFST
jgi:hypothetical protein